MAGMVVYAKIEGFLYYPAFAYGMALTGFIGQNLGSGRLDRVEEAMRISRRTAIYGTMAVCAGLILIAEPLVSFSPETRRRMLMLLPPYTGRSRSISSIP